MQKTGHKQILWQCETNARRKNDKLMHIFLDTESKGMNRCVKRRGMRSYVSSEGGIQKDVKGMCNRACSKWRYFSGILREAKILRRMKLKFYLTAIRPTAIYDSECRQMNKKDEACVKVIKAKLLRWYLGRSCLNCITNEALRKSWEL